MSLIEPKVRDFAELLQRGRSLDAMARYYADDIMVFENRELARAGREQCMRCEREALAMQPEPPSFKVSKLAVNEASGHAFLEYVVRFSSGEGRPLRLEEVVVQTWEGGRIVQERYYYEGFVDEGDDDGTERAGGEGGTAE